MILFTIHVNAQIIAPITFTFGGPFTNFGQVGSLAEDSISEKLHFQISCNCGPGPGNQWSGLSYVNLNNNQYFTPITYYNPYGTRLISTGMEYGNNGINLTDGRYFSRFNSSTYSLAWGFTLTPTQSVVASAMRNDSVFTITSDGSYCQILEVRNRNTGSLITLNTIDCSAFTYGYISGDVLSAKLYGNRLYLAGGFYVFDQFSNLLDTNVTSININTGQIVPLHWAVNDSVKDMDFSNGKLYLAGSFTSVKGQVRNHFASLAMPSTTLEPNTPSFNSTIEKIEIYNKYLFTVGRSTTINSTVVNPSGDVMLKAVDLSSNSIMNWSLPFSIGGNPNDNYVLHRSRNRIFTANRTNGWWVIDAFCLPPIKTTSVISTATTSFCSPVANQTFSISAFPYASTYTWIYTGTGATITNLNNIASVSFAAGATSGKLKVFAQSSCGSVSDTLSLNITVYPRPNATASLVDDTLNCFKPKVPILGNSTTPGVGYAWSGPSSYSSILQNDSTGYHLPGVYTLTVTTLLTGCTRTASVLVRIDTIKPNVTLPVGPYLVGCGTNSLISLNGTSTTTPTTLWWQKQFTSTYTPNPASVSVGNYFLEVRNTYNGCKNTSTLITVTSSAAPPTVTLTSHTFINSLLAVDSISCLTTSVTLSAAFSPTNCTLVWKDNATKTISANPVTVFGQSNQMAIVTRLDNSCVDSSMIVLVKQNITPPNILVLTPNPSINCSSSTATLSAAFSPTPATGVWTGPSSFSSANPAVTSVQGKYYFTVTRSDNGCSKKDSVNVGYSNTLVVDAGNDTTICKSSTANLSAVVVGTVSSVTYSWSSGGSGQTISVNPALTTTYVVTANGSFGCTGKDTVVVNIPADMQDSIVTAKGCTGNNGSLTIYVKGGISPYKFSVNGSPFTTQITYTNLPFATYSVSIRDSIGCILNTTATISQNSNLNSPVFIASTQNFKGDTVVLIDLTVPKADSVKWILPSIASIIGGDMFNPVVVFADTGTFSVTLQAFYGTCMTSTTKLIKIMPLDSAYATLSNNNGIKSLNVFPNPNNGQFTVQVEFIKSKMPVCKLGLITAKTFSAKLFEC
ncbi:MAG: hypothetical protein IPJ32_18745 [Sphingobacteriaceae bacterium]|nr:hypothetical protein [Sphingobacteriaceae bacterium]